MSPPAPFTAPRFELQLANEGCGDLLIEPLPTSEAHRLGAAFAAIDPWAEYGYPASALSAYLAAHEPGAPRFALMLGSDIAGVAGMRLGWLRGPYMQFLAFLPEFQGRGLGSAVLAWMEREARAGHERNLWVAAAEINVGAIRLYERHGFTQTARLEGLVYDGRTEILLRKRL